MYEDLSTRLLTAEEKTALIQLYNNEIHKNPHLSVEAFASRYSLQGNVFRNWISRHTKSGHLHNSRGSPGALDDIAMKDVVAEVKEYRHLNHEAPNRAEITKILQKHVEATSRRSGKPPIPVSSRLASNYIKKLDLRQRVPQVIPPVREKACSDPRMIYSTMVMANALAKDLPPDLIFNWDATTFIIRTPGVDQPVYIVPDDDFLIPPSVVSDDPFPFAIKWLYLANAAGYTAPLILIIGIEAIPADKGHVFSVPGLNCTGDPTSEGFIVFCHSLAGMDSLYRWFIQNQVIKIIEKVREVYGLTDDFNMPLAAFVGCDGEKIVLDEVFNNEILELLQDRNIHVGKLSASCSGILQPLDRSPTFKAAKKRLKTILSCNEVQQNPTLIRYLQEISTEVETIFELSISTFIKDRIICGCLAVQQALNDTLTMKMTKEGFRATGWYPLGLDVMMDLCYDPLSKELRKAMLDAIGEDSLLFLAQGYLTEDQYAQSNIPTLDDPEGLPRDLRALSNNRAVLLTKPEVATRRNSQMSKNIEVQNMLNSSYLSKTEKKQLLAATRHLEAQELANQRKEEAKEQQKRKTAAEKQAEKEARAERTKMNKEKKEKRIEDEQQIIESCKKKMRGY